MCHANEEVNKRTEGHYPADQHPRPRLREEGDRESHFPHGSIVFLMNDDNKNIQVNVYQIYIYGKFQSAIESDKDIPDDLRTSSVP